MPILKLAPACKDYIWGGNKLIQGYGKAFTGDKLAETWELSCHPDGLCTILEGPFGGKTLADFIFEEGRKILGVNCQKYENFPILIKMIDARDNLSIQVHPDNEYAWKHEKQYGKMEAWYIIEADENAGIYYGVNRKLDPDEFAKRIENHTILEVLNFQRVKAGETYFIEYGMLHAIGSGVLVAEIQQSSNITYRVFDYDRVGLDGNKRALNIKQAKEVALLEPFTKKRNSAEHLIACNYFTVDELHVKDKLQMESCADSFHSLLVLEGDGRIEARKEPSTHVNKGDSIFIPADYGEYDIFGEMKILLTQVR